MTRVVVDFNDIRDGLIGALRQYVSGPPAQVGDRVVASDEEAHEVEASVERVEGEAIDLRIDWDTWRALSVRYAQPQGVWTTWMGGSASPQPARYKLTSDSIRPVLINAA